MITGISWNPYYGNSAVQRAYSTAQVSRQTGVYGAQKAADPNTPVQQVRPAPAIQSDAPAPAVRFLPSWNGDNAAEQAVRMRIQYGEGDAAPAAQPSGKSSAAQPYGLPQSYYSAPAGASQPYSAAAEGWESLPNWQGADAAEMAVRMRIQYPGADEAAEDAQPTGVDGEPVGAEGVQKAAEEGRCETCEKRKYQDGSDDPGVSFQTPTHIDPGSVASAVRGHEQEHVVREQAKAQREDRRVVSQTVTLHTDICPECGKAYISGGTTRTVTAANPTEPEPAQQDEAAKQGSPMLTA